MNNELKLIRYSEENKNTEALKGKYGFIGEDWGAVTVFKNLVLINVNRGASVKDYPLPEVYDGFLVCSNGTFVNVNNSTLTIDLGPSVCAQGTLKLVKDN